MTEYLQGEQERNKTSFLCVFLFFTLSIAEHDPNPPFNLEGIYSLDKSLFGWFMSPLVLSHRWSFMSSKGPVINRLGWTRKKKKKAPSLCFSFFLSLINEEELRVYTQPASG